MERPAPVTGATDSPEVAADPARAAIYYREHPPAVHHDGPRVFIAQGCGHTDMYDCDNSFSQSVGGDGRSYMSKTCSCMARIAGPTGSGADFTKLTSMEATLSCIKVSENQFMNNGATPK